MGRGGHCSLGDMRDGMRGQAFLGVAHFPGDAPGPLPPLFSNRNRCRVPKYNLKRRVNFNLYKGKKGRGLGFILRPVKRRNQSNRYSRPNFHIKK